MVWWSFHGCPISIHAPVKGATWCICGVAKVDSISIHAPVKGATKLFESVGDTLIISIHAPVKGATRQLSQAQAAGKNFNPRSREGSDG